MHRLPVMFGMATLGFALVVGVGATQDAKKDKDTKKEGDKVIKGSVPFGWKPLKLTKDQTNKIKMIDVEYKTKIGDLNKKIDELKEQSRIEMAKQLNEEQKTHLAKLQGLDVKDKGKEKDKDKEKDKK